MLIAAVSLESLSTVATVFTAVVIGATAVAALIQLRHLRTGNDIAAMLSIGEHFSSSEFKHAEEMVVHKLSPAMSDSAFREYVLAFVRDPAPREVEHGYVELRRSAVLIGNVYEELGILVKAGIVDKKLFLDRYCTVIIRSWNRLLDFTAFIRDVQNDRGIWENFEYITVLAEDWLRAHQTSYPHGVRHLDVRNRWPFESSRTFGDVRDGRVDSTAAPPPARL